MVVPAKISIPEQAHAVTEEWKNFVAAEVNDHVVRASVLKRDFHWHHHANSDEAFLVVEGELWIDFEEGSVLLKPGEMLTVPKGVRHRTRPNGRRVNLTFEHRDTDVRGDCEQPAA
jgi:mannose-6-phosphate isomerase-like protein (cupin superfamily)